MQLHHINGNHFDNRVENLQILCPNCHSQTVNFRNKKRDGKTDVKTNNVRVITKEHKAHKIECEMCGKVFYSTRDSKFCCRKCYEDYLSKNMSKDVLIDEIKELADECVTITELSEKVGTNRTTVRDMMKRLGIYDSFKNKRRNNH